MNDYEYNNYSANNRLRRICPLLLKYYLPGVKPLIEAELEIRKDENYSKIINLLSLLQNDRQISIKNVKTLSRDTLEKLNQLSVITISLDNVISITKIGELIISLLFEEIAKEHKR